MKKKIVVTQPCYLSWCGYYAMLDACDTFVFYDDIQFSHQSWQHRNKIRNQDSWMWLTVPIIRREGQLINETMIDNSKHWAKDHWRSISQNYSHAPCFKDYKDCFETIYQAEWNKLVDLNIVLVQALAYCLGIKMPTMMLSSGIETSGNKTDRLVPILKELGADTYISGVAAKGYLEVSKLNDAGIEVRWFEYAHPVYPQKDKFIAYLSAIDLLFNTGNKAIDYIRQGVNLVGGEP